MDQAPHEAHHRYLTKIDGNLKFLFMMMAFFLLAYLIQVAQSKQNDVISTQNVVVAELKSSNVVDCNAHNSTTAKMNSLIDELVTSVQQGNTLSSSEQSDRIARYTALKVTPQICPK